MGAGLVRVHQGPSVLLNETWPGPAALHERGHGTAPEGKGAGLVLPRGTSEGMELHRKEIAQAVAPGAHAAVLLDRAGWHVSTKRVVPDNITLVPLPPRSPELNPVETVWPFLRENWISNRVFSSYTDILDHCCAAWNRLTDQPWRIMSLGLRDWAHRF